MDNQQGPTIQHKELCSVLCGNLDRTAVWGRMVACVCMAELLCCAPETVINCQSAVHEYKMKHLNLKRSIYYSIYTSVYYTSRGDQHVLL